MNKYRIKTSVDIHDVDYNGIAKTSSILKYIQTAAQYQLTDNGMSYDGLKSKNKVFVISRLKLEIIRPLRSYTPLTAITYPCDSRGYSFLRGYALECDGEIVAKALSVWALVDTETKSLVRVNDFDLGLPTIPENELTIGHIQLPSTLTDVGGYGVHYGDVDQNMHMNNTKYPDMYSNFLSLEGKRIKTITIHYAKEAKLGEKLRVQRAFAEDRFYFRTLKYDGTTNSEAEIELCDI